MNIEPLKREICEVLDDCDNGYRFCLKRGFAGYDLSDQLTDYIYSLLDNAVAEDM